MSTHQQRLRFLAWMIDHGLDEETADAILMSMSPFDWRELATKADVENLRLATKADLENLRLATKADIETFRVETKADIDAVRTDLNELRIETKADIARLGSELRAEFPTRAEMNDGFAQLRLEMNGLRQDVRLTLFAVLGFILTVLLAAAGAGVTFLAG